MLSLAPQQNALESPVGEPIPPAIPVPRPALETSASTIRNSLPETVRGRLLNARQMATRPPARRLWTTADPRLDRLLDGGIHRGVLLEMVGRRSSGRFSLLLTMLAAVTASGHPVVLIDLGDGLDPRLAEQAGIDLARLLWLRPRRMKEALAGAEAVLASGFPLVALDLGTPPVPGGRGAQGSWLRLARAARDRDAALVVSAPYRVSGTTAATVVMPEASRPLWSGHGITHRVPAPTLDAALATGLAPGLAPGQNPGPAPRRLIGLCIEWTVHKRRGQSPGDRAGWTLTTTAAHGAVYREVYREVYHNVDRDEIPDDTQPEVTMPQHGYRAWYKAG